MMEDRGSKIIVNPQSTQTLSGVNGFFSGIPRGRRCALAAPQLALLDAASHRRFDRLAVLPDNDHSSRPA